MKSVSSSKYNQEYYLTKCSGFNQYKKSYGKLLEPRLKLLTLQLKIPKDAVVLDLGCGRGELAIWAASKGGKVYGIDYSSEAVKLSNIALSKQPQNIKKKISFLQMNAKKLKFADNTFDIVTCLEVWEHLYPNEQKIVIKEILRVLKPGGVAVIHTEPNKIFNEFTYRFWCYPVSSLVILINKLVSGKNYPNLPKWDAKEIAKSKRLHVNEPTYFALKNLFSEVKGSVTITSPNVIWTKPQLSWKDIVYNLLVYLYPLSCFWPFKIHFGQDFLITIKKS